ncbi:MAG: hypothetical protein HC831_16690 [Chloroflexia bacterium]|nr:hypothetical protein [Chloroflexia bacterium]
MKNSYCRWLQNPYQFWLSSGRIYPFDAEKAWRNWVRIRKLFEQEVETYAVIFNEFGSVVTSAREELKELDFKQQQWAAAAQGFYLEKEGSVNEPTEGGDHGTYFNEDLGKEVSPGEEGYDIEKFQALMQAKYASELAENPQSEALPKKQ